MNYELTVPCVIADTPAGKLYVYKPALLPEDTNPEQVKSLLADGLIKKADGFVSEPYAGSLDAAAEQALLDAAAAETASKAGLKSSTSTKST